MRNLSSPLYNKLYLSLFLSISLGNHIDLHAARDKNRDLFDMTLEELLNIQVYSLHKFDSDYFTIPAAITVITREEIENSGAQTFSDLFVTVPGLFSFQHQAHRSSISIRDDAQVFISATLVLLDGIPVYYPTSGGPEFQLLGLPLEDIEKIEIIRGSGGSSWGANATSGVINILSRRAEQFDGSYFRISGSSRGGFEGFWRESFQKNNVFGYFTAGAESDPGFDNEASNQEDYSRQYIRARVDFSLSEWDFTSNIYLVNNDRVEEQFFSHSANIHNDTEEADSTSRILQLQANYSPDDKNSLTIQPSYKKDLYEIYTLPANYRTTQTDLEVRYQRTWSPSQQSQVFVNKRLYDFDIGLPLPNFVNYVPNKTLLKLSALGVNHISQLTPSLKFEVGGRIEEFSTISSTFFSPGGRLSYRINDSLVLWGNYTRSYQFPTYLQLASRISVGFTPLPNAIPIVQAGSSDVDAEKNDDYGIGLRWKNKNHFVDLTYFSKKTYGQIRVDPRAAELQEGPVLALPYANSVDVETQGFEATWNYHSNHYWRSKIDFTYYDSLSKLIPPDANSVAHSTVPKYKVSWTQSLALSTRLHWHSRLTWYDHYNSENIQGIFAEPIPIDAHWRLDTNISYRINAKTTAIFALKNGFNNEHEAIYQASTAHPEKVEPSLHFSIKMSL
ncbi:TonB-dependent siderophore receptor [Pleionea sp. CnH1-48]|uniref:TonB-dependent receptor plug domain-containing protein n=1 Tax=Pleionea sp. CnH1-48 TaxID=2954494 RepID=UPI002096AB82|nr:TonB-dependent receptor [Pleionea sp. CnH1-48]MCO7226264.1 TonB-dependent receptor [Pleionea sp. CnH1-48]